ncbi:hypothetical protein chiPu_0028163, partial [Chiloscyllium punctatum]|nr:hypothetical protein [Chiloscyllium punctatum]
MADGVVVVGADRSPTHVLGLERDYPSETLPHPFHSSPLTVPPLLAEEGVTPSCLFTVDILGQAPKQNGRRPISRTMAHPQSERPMALR